MNAKILKWEAKKTLEKITENNEDNKISEKKQNLNLIDEENNIKNIINEMECENDENKNDNIEINKSE